MEIIAQTELVSINATLLSQLASFLIFLFLINRLMFRPLRQTMEERRDRVKELKLAVEKQEKQLGALAAEMRKQERVLKNEAFRESEKLEEAGKQEAQQILDAALDEIKSHHETAVAERRARVKRLRQELQNETETLVAAILESLLGRRTDS